MNQVDLKHEHQNTLKRPRYKYALLARIFFTLMDVLAGKKTSLSKLKLLEIPYREWELKEYFRITRQFRNREKVEIATEIIEWGREAQDNEYTHLLVIHEKMKADNVKDAWYLHPVVTFFVVYSYVFMSKVLKTFSLRSAFYFNAQFEDHAEHVYAEVVLLNPAWETQEQTSELVRKYTDVNNWADVFRRIGLDERNHRNQSFYYCGKPQYIVVYDGMPLLNF